MIACKPSNAGCSKGIKNASRITSGMQVHLVREKAVWSLFFVGVCDYNELNSSHLSFNNGSSLSNLHAWTRMVLSAKWWAPAHLCSGPRSWWLCWRVSSRASRSRSCSCARAATASCTEWACSPARAPPSRSATRRASPVPRPRARSRSTRRAITRERHSSCRSFSALSAPQQGNLTDSGDLRKLPFSVFKLT